MSMTMISLTPASRFWATALLTARSYLHTESNQSNETGDEAKEITLKEQSYIISNIGVADCCPARAPRSKLKIVLYLQSRYLDKVCSGQATYVLHTL